MQWATLKYLESVVKDEEIRQLLTPKYTIGFRLPVVALPDFYEAFNRENVSINPSRVASVEETTVHTEDGKTTKLDVRLETRCKA